MKPLQEAKRELELRVKSLQDTIVFLKENSYYEDFCKHCNSIMKVKVIKRFAHKSYCSDSCRNKAWKKEK